MQPRFFVSLAVAAALLFPMGASALTSEEIIAQAEALLKQITALQAQLGLIPSSTEGTGISNSCPQFTRSLTFGMSGEDVKFLQQFLAKDPAIYPEALVTGYFGALTQAAVQRFQVKNNIVSSGSPATTGFGIVGPRTSAAIKAQCGSGGGLGNETEVGGYIQVAPVAGQAPLSVVVTATVNTVHSCAGATYMLDWGDGSQVQSIIVPAGQCGQKAETFTHIFANPGAYTLRLSSGAHETSASVSVSGMASQSQGGVQTPPVQAMKVSASQTYGQAPLTVTFTGIVNTKDASWRAGVAGYDTPDFGDGTSVNVPLPTQANTAQSFTVQHTYVRSGTYQAIMFQGAKESATAVVPGSPINITVTGASQGGIVSQSTMQMTNTEFTPKTRTITSGTVMTWTNTSSVPHTVTADNGSYNSGTLQPGQSYSLTFTIPGAYTFYCTFHGGPGGVGMSGTITVN